MLALLALACGSPTGDPAATNAGGAPSPPIEVDLAATDAATAEHLTGLVAAARERPESAWRRADLGMAYEVNGMLRAATDSYAQAVALEPDEPRWRYYLAQARAQAGDLDDALAEIDGVIEAQPNYLPAHLNRGAWLLDRGRAEEALAAFTAASSLDDGGPASTLGRARALMRLGRHTEAVEQLDALTGNFRHPYAFQLLGQALRLAGDLERARSALARGASQQPPRWSDPWHAAKARHQVGFSADLMRAEAMLGAGQAAEAIELLEKVRRDHPDDEVLLNSLSIGYRRLGRADDARRVLEDGLGRHPDSFALHLNLANMALQDGDLPGGLRHYEQAIEINPNLSFAHAQRASLLTRLGDENAALDAYHRALELDARDARVFHAAGVLHLERGDADEALRLLGTAARLRPEQAEFHLAHARALIAAGRTQQAEDALAAARAAGAGNEALTAAQGQRRR